MRVKRFRSRKSKFQRIKAFVLKFWGHILLGLGILALGLLTLYTIYALPSVSDADQLSFAESTIIYARGALEPGEDPNDHILYTIHGDENREYIPLEEISPWVEQATLAIEDDQFYSHFGFDIGGIVKGALNHFLGWGNARGGSTITQQLVKNTFLNNDRSVIRKFNELLLSIKLELTYSKKEILELYLNKIPYGNNAYGIEAAAKTYFDKSARDLTIAESAILASLPVAPTRFNPFGSNRDLLMGFYEMQSSFLTEEEARAAEVEKSDENQVRVYKKGRKDLVLQRMLDLKEITQQQFQQAWSEALSIEFKSARTDIKAPHFVFYVRERVEEKYGKEFLNQGGLRIYTTLNMDLQKEAESIVESKTGHYADTYGAKNLALTAIENGSGEILSYIGGKDFFDEKNDGQVDVLTSRRQPGSSFKPLVYAAGFGQGYGPGTVMFDSETDFGAGYTPQNFDETFAGPVTLRRALNASLNIPAIKMAVLAGPARILALATELGIKYEGNAGIHGVAIGVGVAEVEPLSHISSFQAFAGDGSWFEPTAILQIQNAENQVLEKTDVSRRQRQGLATEIAALVRNILTDEASRPTTDGFDWNKLLQLERYDNGAKTGTSNRVAENPEFNEQEEESDENRRFITVPGDSWTIGFTPHLTTGVWVGNNRGEPMKSGATGLAVAAPVWKTFSDKAHELLELDPDTEYPEEISFQTFEINRLSGGLATDKTPESLKITEIFPSSALPTDRDQSLQEQEIDLLTGLIATSETPEQLREARTVLSLNSIRPDIAKWQESVEAWFAEHPNFIHTLGEDFSEEWVPPAPETLLSSNRQERKESLRQRLERLRRTNTGLLGPAPEIKILSPSAEGVVSPGKVEIQVQVSAQSEIEAVEFYFDDQLVDESVRQPYTGEFTLPNNFEIGSSHRLKVVVIDRSYQSGEDEIEIKIGQDRAGPEILFLSPTGGQQIPINSLYEVQLEVIDRASALESVDISLDGVLVEKFSGPPFRVQIVASTDLGRKQLKVVAADVHGNATTRSLPVTYGRESLIRGDAPIIETIINQRNSLAVTALFPVPENITAARVRVVDNGREIYLNPLDSVARTVQLSLDKNLHRGKAQVQLQVQASEGWVTVDSKAVNF